MHSVLSDTEVLIFLGDVGAKQEMDLGSVSLLSSFLLNVNYDNFLLLIKFYVAASVSCFCFFVMQNESKSQSKKFVLRFFFS